LQKNVLNLGGVKHVLQNSICLKASIPISDLNGEKSALRFFPKFGLGREIAISSLDFLSFFRRPGSVNTYAATFLCNKMFAGFASFSD